jgi:hypothetical protein
MFVIRSESYPGGPNKASGKPDGMMVREDGWFTDNKASAKLFNTVDEAVKHHTDVLVPLWGPGAGSKDVHVVEVEVKYVVAKASKVSLVELA